VPEGDTVFRAARTLHRALAGSVLRRTDFRVPQVACADLSGQRVTEVVARGKHILLRTDAGNTLHTHFIMDGEWVVQRVAERLRGGPEHEIRVILETEEWRAVGWRLPVVELLRTRDEATVVGHLGPDVLGEDWDEAEVLRRLRAQPERPIAEALLDQRNLAGIGNVYKCEVLFLRGADPWTPVGEVADLPACVRLAQRMMRANLERAERTTTGRLRRDQKHWVYGRQGQACRRCGGLIRMASQGEGPTGERSTWWCPRCQPRA